MILNIHTHIRTQSRMIWCQSACFWVNKMHFDETFRGSEIECVCMYVIIWIRFSFYNKTNLVVWNVQNCLVIDHINQMSLSIDPNATNCFDIIFLFLYMFFVLFSKWKKKYVFFSKSCSSLFLFWFLVLLSSAIGKKLTIPKKVIKLANYLELYRNPI